MKIKNWKSFNESISDIISNPLFIIGGTALAIKLMSKLSDYLKMRAYKNYEVPDERARKTGDDELSKTLYDRLKQFISLSRSSKCKVYEKDNILSVYVERKGKMGLLFEINKSTNILKTEFGNKIKLEDSEIDEIDNLVHWYKKN
jgi:hypothetical protein